MIDFTISLAGIPIGISAIFESTREFCREYLTQEKPSFHITVTKEDIRYERDKSAREDAFENIPRRRFSPMYLETLAVYRKITDRMLSRDVLLFHGSSIAVDGEGYLFTASSGTGKSTHVRLWREAFGDRAVMINDDKPLLKITGNGVWVCGTPWDGKHRLSTNAIVPLKGICILERGVENTIVRIGPEEALPILLQQSHRPADPVHLEKLLVLVDQLMRNMKFYRLQCNMEPQAALVAYEEMRKGK